MSSSDEGQLKGGHPPAVKAGGMRITQHKVPKDERESKGNEGEDHRPTSSFLNIHRAPKAVTVSGAVAKGNADFPPEAVQNFHEKPVPTHADRSVNSRPVVIQQPRK